MRRSSRWLAGFSLLTLFATINCESGYVSRENENCSNKRGPGPDVDDRDHDGNTTEDNDDKKNGETDVDCGGKFCDPCAEGKTCLATEDCATGLQCDREIKICRSTYCSNKTKDADETDKDCGGSCAPCTAGKVCRENRDCVSTLCRAGKCTAASCSDKTKNQNESDLDCGDPSGLCDPCEGGKKCIEDGNCASQICKRGICTEASCVDRVRNGTEGDVDCGGSCETLCGQGDTCKTDTDCKSGVCNETCKDAACGDEVRNGTETDVDCGGSCGGCLEGKACNVGADCKSTFCFERVCTLPTCSDNVQNQGEADIDCGRPSTTCAPCVAGKTCLVPTDCASGVCTDGRCVAPSCTDKVKNGNEGATDCGGNCPTRCPDNSTCKEMSDCQSGVCTLGYCSIPTCSDDKKNGNETDVDCGGSCSAKCGLGKGCNANTDCAINSCSGGVCSDPSCNNNAVDGAETALDCGGDRCRACTEGKACALSRDCDSGRCVNKLCAQFGCNDQVENGGETGTDCGGGCERKCAVGDGCGTNSDCASGKCSGAKCRAPVCNDEVQNDLETDIDCGGAICTVAHGTCENQSSCMTAADCGGAPCTVLAARTCANGRSCLVDQDCSTKVCNAINGKCQAQSCNDKRKNQDETDVDCGGLLCPQCPTTKRCLVPADCADGVCGKQVPGVCDAPACDDTVKNGTEGDVNCGAVCATETGLCPVGKTCNGNADCVEGVCGTGNPAKCLASTCTDGVKNGKEIDVDCVDVDTCPTKKCKAGQNCLTVDDCATEGQTDQWSCKKATGATLGVCTAPGCGDGKLNNSETDTDCGGNTGCDRCLVGKACLVDTDCESVTSGHCVGKVCVAATCEDARLNSTETDLDCGGPNAKCKRCPDAAVCDQNSDCSSQICEGKKCQVPTCVDKARNGAETALDCGGATCATQGSLCANDLSCAADRDCVSGWCQKATADASTGLCKTRTCIDKTQNGLESDVDCGEVCPTSKCGLTKKCGKDADCANGNCSECIGVCVETPENCLKQGATNCNQCATGGACSVDSDCASFNCVSGKCAAADNCAGQLLTEADGKFADLTDICAVTNAMDKPKCQAFLRCFFVKTCDPSTDCFTNGDKDCGVNKGIGDATSAASAKATWLKAKCTVPSSKASGL